MTKKTKTETETVASEVTQNKDAGKKYVFFVRYGLSAEEYAIISKAAEADFHRINVFSKLYTLRCARRILAEYGAADSMQEFSRLLSEERKDNGK